MQGLCMTDAILSRLTDLSACLSQGLIGRGPLIERLMICLLTDRHMLIEGAPGLAKTRAVKLLATQVDAKFSRIQCTPDLMPADVTGSMIFRPDAGAFDFAPGPVFASVVLVDEINRAPPKVQSALLEAMEERQVTAAGVTHPLPDPFIVVATQNPIEHEGTFPLPEAQLDRFMFYTVLELPNAEDERRILDLVEAEGGAGPSSVIGEADKAHPARLSLEQLSELRQAAAQVHASSALKDFIVRLVTATREPSHAPEAQAMIEHPVSPRGSLALAAAAKARALLQGRDYAAPEDVAALATDVLAHRLSLTWRASAEGFTGRRVVQDILQAVHPL